MRKKRLSPARVPTASKRQRGLRPGLLNTDTILLNSGVLGRVAWWQQGSGSICMFTVNHRDVLCASRAGPFLQPQCPSSQAELPLMACAGGLCPRNGDSTAPLTLTLPWLQERQVSGGEDREEGPQATV